MGSFFITTKCSLYWRVGVSN